MSLLQMPIETLLYIPEELRFHRDLNNFARANRHLYKLLNTHVTNPMYNTMMGLPCFMLRDTSSLKQ